MKQNLMGTFTIQSRTQSLGAARAVRCCAALLGGGTLIWMCALPQAAQAHNVTPSSNCQSVRVPVALTEGAPANYTIAGELCLPASGQANTVVLTVHGGTYDHHYWDWTNESPLLYSYRNFMNAAGYAVFAYDRIGNGQSSHPVSTDISISSNGFVAHELVQDLRNGQVNGYRFKNVVIAGHSYGSYTSWVEAGVYRDVDAVIVTGIGHAANSSAGQSLWQDFYPAQQDPAFANMGLDSGYLTTRPGTRGTLFYYSATTDPSVVATDETTKQTVTQTEIDSALATGPGSALGDSSLITAPVLIVNGQQDAFYCQGTTAAICSSSEELQAAERPYYGASPSVTAFVVPATGHDINLELTAPSWYAYQLAWLLTIAKVAP